MLIPLIILGFSSIFYGFLTRDLIIGLGSNFFNNVFINYYNFNLIDSEFLHALIKNIPFIFTVLGSLFSLALIHCFYLDKEAIYNFKLQKLPRLFYIFLNKK
jgi:NADH-ubiquinone oxidoreductase chain 5